MFASFYLSFRTNANSATSNVKQAPNAALVSGDRKSKQPATNPIANGYKH